MVVEEERKSASVGVWSLEYLWRMDLWERYNFLMLCVDEHYIECMGTAGWYHDKVSVEGNCFGVEVVMAVG
jgi:hypothetical protein